MIVSHKSKSDQIECWDADCLRSSHYVSIRSYASMRKRKSHPWEKLDKIKRPHLHIERKTFSRISDDLQRNVFSVDKRFNELAKSWKKETAMSSLVRDKIINSNYLEIIGLGRTFKDTIVKLILADLEKREEFWHYALKSITDTNPVPKGMVNNLSIVRDYWLEWGKRQQII